ncbi:IS240-type transposase (ISH103) [Natrinema gari JCM 14663]|uniref:IS240-type transposase (ISH103) n=1 Tax=Natrinema gari JCM 14663 TaxID=1230459 RepID=L9ZDD8_9EURY|nr:IS240-type transposase (ISH103) [Natrinema gari JCM 14663]
MRPIRTWSVLRTAKPSRVAVDEIAVTINGDRSWLYTAIDLETTLIFDVALFSRHGTNRLLRFFMDLPRTTISPTSVSRRWCWLADCPLSVRLEQLPRLC